MKLTKNKLRALVQEVIAETDAHPNLVKKNKEISHN